MEKTTKFAAYFTDKQREDMERCRKLEGSRSTTEYVRNAVELDMFSGIIADSFRFTEDDLRRRRAASVRNVKQTNGRISFEKRVRESWEEDDDQ